jgi:hypothetical protein
MAVEAMDHVPAPSDKKRRGSQRKICEHADNEAIVPDVSHRYTDR